MRVALLVPTEKLTSLELSCIDEINRSSHDITLVLRAPKDDNFNYKQQRRKNWIKRAYEGDYGFLIEWEKRIGEKLAPKTKCIELGALTKRKWTLKDLDADLQGVVIQPELVEVGHRKYDLGEDVIKALRESADVLVLIGFNRLLKGHVLDACKHGVLSTHPSNTFEKRGRPDTFFEWINENKTLTYTLQRLNNSVDGGEVIAQEKVDISSAKSLSEAKYLVRTVRPKLYVPGLTKLENGEKSFPVPGSESELTRSRDRDRLENVVQYLLVSLKKRYL